MIVDLSESTFIDSTIASSLLRYARDAALSTVVAGPGGESRRLLDLLHFGEVTLVVESRDAALRALRESA